MKAFDIAVVGGGVIGTSIAFELAAEKLRVVVLDRQQPGQEASWAAAGMLSPAPDSPRDLPLVPLGRESLKLYSDFAVSIEEASGRSIGYEREGAIELFTGANAESDCAHRLSDCRALGIAAEKVKVQEARAWESAIGPEPRAALWLPEEARVEPRALMDALLVAARNRGVEFRDNFPVSAILIDRERCTGVLAAGDTIAADHTVIAAGCFSSQISAVTNALTQYVPTRPVRGQMMALRAAGLRLQRVLRSECGYLVPRRNGTIVAGSTSEEAGFEKRVTVEGTRKILNNALELVPALANAEVIETWSGLRPGTPDDLPILGPTEIGGLLIATGHYRNGILLAAITAKLMKEWVTIGRTSFPAETFSPLRFAKRKLHAQQAG